MAQTINEETSLVDNPKLGKKLFEIGTDSSYGNPVNMIYYLEGIPQFDKLLNGDKFWDYGYLFTMASFEGAIVLTFTNSKHQIYFSIYRENISKAAYSQPFPVEIVKQNKIINAFKSGAYGSGLIGSIASIAIGHAASKIAGIKTTEETGMEYHLYYFDENGEEKEIIVYATGMYNDLLFAFVTGYYTKVLPEKSKKPIEQDNSCYVATLCYRSSNAKELIFYRNFRDNTLNKFLIGKWFIKTYYKLSPFLIRVLISRPKITALIKTLLLDPFYRFQKNAKDSSNGKSNRW